ncbi:DUF2312 domain-containing protein [Sinorhizobium meliloti]|uniref:DUF2312 domain-containing protein n=1 Tax=Rhizobium meliloti TaxID=382 RepID=UPI00209031F2|nr:GapR family DNA-binding domain-containing protein [Sinorhizobium meliloti]MCO5962331.1 DUF2312 domain-containing protein [Sinorhizobium meliloti]
MTSDVQIRAFIDRILRLKEEQDTIGEDIRDIYAEAKSMGFDKTAMGNVVAHLRKVAKKGSDTVAEQGAIFDLYLCAYEGKSPHAPAPARARENIEQFDPTTGEIIEADVSAKLVETIAAGVQTEVGRAALIAAVDIMIEREEQEIASASQGETESPSAEAEASGANAGGGNVESSAERADINAVASASGPDEKRATNSPEEAMQSLGDGDTDIRTDDAVGVAVTGTGTPRAGVTVVGTESGTVSQLTKPKYVLRPNCRNPEACGGYGANHCHPCQKAMREQAEEVA